MRAILILALVSWLAACATPPSGGYTDPALMLSQAQTAVARATGTQQAAAAATYQANAIATAAAVANGQATAAAASATVAAATATRQAVDDDLAAQATRLALGEIAGQQTRAAQATTVALEQIAQAEAILIADHQAELANRRQQEAIALQREQIMIYVTPVLWLVFLVVAGVLGASALGWLRQRNRVIVQQVNGRDIPFTVGDVRVLPGRVMSDALALPAPAARGTAVPLPALIDGHVMVAGPTRSGKSTALRAIAAMRDNVVVLDPHARPGAWPGARVIGGGRDFQSIASFMAYMMDELNDRSQMMNETGGTLPPLTVITDEMPSITAALGNDTLRIWQAWVREGWKFGLYFIVGTQSLLVKSLGIEGQGDLRDNFLNAIVLGSLARREFPELTAGQDRPAVLIPQHDEPYPVVIPYNPDHDPHSSAFGGGYTAVSAPPQINLPRPVTQAEKDARLLEDHLATITSQTNAGAVLGRLKGTLSEGVNPSADMIAEARAALEWRVKNLGCEQSRWLLNRSRKPS